MKLYKVAPLVPYNSKISIVKVGTSYETSSRGEAVGHAVLTVEEYHQVVSRDYSCLLSALVELGLEFSEAGFSLDGTDDMAAYDNNPQLQTTVTIFKNSKARNELPYGSYIFRANKYGMINIRPHLINENKVNLIVNKNLKQTVQNFFENPAEGRKNKLGILVYGAPGNGKTTDIMEIAHLCASMKIYMFFIDAKSDLDQLEDIRGLLQNERTVFVLEEMTERLRTQSLETLLTFLDGETSWENSVTIASTNYPEEFPANLVDRPGRFEQFIEYKNPTREQIVELAKAFGIKEDAVTSLIGQDLSFDYISFMLSQSIKLGLSVKETRTEEESKRKRLSTTFRGKIGF